MGFPTTEGCCLLRPSVSPALLFGPVFLEALVLLTGCCVLGLGCASRVLLGPFGGFWGAVMCFFPSQFCLGRLQGERDLGSEQLEPAG